MRLRSLTDPEEIALRAPDVVISGALGIGIAIACIAYFARTPAVEHSDQPSAYTRG